MADDTGYTSQYGWQLYDTSGTTEDWNYGAAGTFGYTIELGPADVRAATSTSPMTRAWSTSGTAPAPAPDAACARRSCASPNGRLRRPDFPTVYGGAPAGRILRPKKTFKTSLSPVCQFATVD